MRDKIIITCDEEEYERLENKRDELLADSQHARAAYCQSVSDAYLSTCAIPPGMADDIAAIIARYISVLLSAEGRSRPLPAMHFVFRQ